MIKSNILYILSVALVLDLIIPFILAPFYQGYSSKKQVMSVLGNHQAPLHVLYNGWLVFLGVIILYSTIILYPIIIIKMQMVANLLCLVLVVYAVGGCVLSGIFSVEETKNTGTISETIHGSGAVIGFLLLTLAPLLISIYLYEINIIFASICFLFFFLTILFFVLFVMADKVRFQNTWIALEGVWQRLTLLFMYLPIIILCVHI